MHSQKNLENIWTRAHTKRYQIYELTSIAMRDECTSECYRIIVTIILYWCILYYNNKLLHYDAIL